MKQLVSACVAVVAIGVALSFGSKGSAQVDDADLTEAVVLIERQREGGLEAVAAGGHGVDEIAAFQGRPIERLAGHACLRIPEGNARLLGPVVRYEVRKAIVVGVLRSPGPLAHGRSSAWPEGQSGCVNLRHVEGVGPEVRVVRSPDQLGRYA